MKGRGRHVAGRRLRVPDPVMFGRAKVRVVPGGFVLEQPTLTWSGVAGVTRSGVQGTLTGAIRLAGWWAQFTPRTDEVPGGAEGGIAR